MRNIFLIFIISSLLVSCYRYEEPTLVSLSGEYIVDKIVVNVTEGPNTGLDTTYLPGDVFINENDTFPLNQIDVGYTKWHFDYSVVSFLPYVNPAGQVEWSEQYFYSLIPSYTQYDLGYVDINMMKRRLVLKIVDDSAESLTFRTTGQWLFFNVWEESSITLQLTRVGP
jgi:hypothetical protein